VIYDAMGFHGYKNAAAQYLPLLPIGCTNLLILPLNCYILGDKGYAYGKKSNAFSWT